MTTLSKILVFVNLLFSALTGFMIVVVFATRTNWKTGYEGVSQQLRSERTAYLNLQAKFDMERDLMGAELGKRQADVAALNNQLKLLQKERDDARIEFQAEKAKADGFDNKQKALTSAMESMKVEIKSLDERLAAEQERVKQLGLQNKEYKSEAIKSKTDLESALERNRQLLAKLIETQKKLQNAEDPGSAKTGQETAKNPPPEDVRGRVTATDDAAGWVTINLGSDNGINRGHTMEIFRLRPKPAYVGTLRIYEVRANEAVGKLIGNGARGRVQKDDEVASKILGSP